VADATCPNCDSPAPARARSCAHCGYTFVEDAGPVPRRPGERRPLPGRALAVGGAALAAVVAALALALVLGGGGANEEPAAVAGPSTHLPVLAEHPLGRRALERVLEERFLPVPDDDEADVTCSARIPEPAHSLRRCRVAYPGFVGRDVVVLTTAAGAEVLSEP
jgi:hypothetical protein